MLSQDTHSISYFSKKLSEAKSRYSNYDQELYAVVQALKFWRHYLLHNDFTLYSDHDALRFLHSQKKLSARHARWIEILQDFTFSLQHRPGRDNKVADALAAANTLHKFLRWQSQDLTTYLLSIKTARTFGRPGSILNYRTLLRSIINRGLHSLYTSIASTPGFSSSLTTSAYPLVPPAISSFGSFMVADSLVISASPRPFKP